MRISSRRVLLQGEVQPATLQLHGGTIASVEGYAPAGGVDWGDALLAPGIIDVHGDAFERQWMPRARVFFPLDIALAETDRQLLSNGITTAYHGLTVSWEPGLRGIEHGRLMVDALRSAKDRLRCDTRLHLRFEVYALDEVPELLDWIASGSVDLIGFNDHLAQIAAHLEVESKAGKYAERSGLSLAEFRMLLGQAQSRAPEIPSAVERIAEAAARHAIPLASHDDETPEMRARYARLGARICEFPVDELTARAAIGDGAEVVFGGPNVVRGKSHTGRLAAAPAFAKGLGTVMSSDYYYPALLHGVYRLIETGGLSLPGAWALVTANAARALRLEDRGQLTAGKRADVLAVDDRDPALPRVLATWAKGRCVYAGDPSLFPAAAFQ